MPDFVLDGVAVSATPGESVLAACLRTGIALQTVCKGKGICGACRVSVESATALPEPSPNEARLLAYLAKGAPGVHRLACQIIMEDGLRGLALSAFPIPRKTPEGVTT
jgi:ferredoxin